MSMGPRALEVLEHSGDFVLAFSVLCGAAFVAMRSRAAGLWVALAGVVACFCVPIEFVLSSGRFARMPIDEAWTILTLVGIARHVAIFGGLALALRTVAQGGRA